MKGPLIAITFLISGSALAQGTAPSGTHQSDPPTPGQSATTQLSPRDRRFLQTATTNNLAQINLGWIGMQQGKTDRVRDFGQETANDHSQANDRLGKIATRAGVSLPTQPTDEQRATEDRLWTTEGRDFDRSYVAAVKKSQRQASAALRDEAKHGHDPALKSLAKSLLRQHQTLATRSSHRM
jgi:putative membrane protein